MVTGAGLWARRFDFYRPLLLRRPLRAWPLVPGVPDACIRWLDSRGPPGRGASFLSHQKALHCMNRCEIEVEHPFSQMSRSYLVFCFWLW